MDNVKIKYNASNDKVEEIKTDAKGKRLKRTTYEYDSKGMITNKKVFDEKGELLDSKTYKYEY